MPPTDDMRMLRSHVERWAHKRGVQGEITVEVDRIEADDLFAMLESRHALYLFSFDRIDGVINDFALYGESATLTMLALTRLNPKPRDPSFDELGAEHDGATWRRVLRARWDEVPQ